MSIALLVIPDFLIILFGWLLRHRLGYEREFFSRLEKLVYYVLFPCLLFKSLSSSTLNILDTLDLLLAVFALIMSAAAVAWTMKLRSKNSIDFASSVQCAFRFNSYLALALSQSLLPSGGTAIMALIMGLSIPMVNLLSVYALSRLGQAKLLVEIIRNPLLIATTLGFLYNLSGLPLPRVLFTLIDHISQAALPTALLCVGAAIIIKRHDQNWRLIGFFSVVKLAVMPILAILIGHFFGLSFIQQATLVLFASLPTAPASYVLAIRMHGNGQIVALLISLQTFISMISIPLWMSFILN